MIAKEIVDFWFAEECRKCWFNSTPEMDDMIRQRFESVWKDARDNQLNAWMNTPEGCLALVIILDQFPLNMYRGKATSFSTETQARDVARHAIEQEFDKNLSREQKAFLYLPYMHSESIEDQNTCIDLFEQHGMTDNLRWARHHHDIVKRFGRFPHRNSILGRENSPQEAAYLQSDEAFMG